MRRRFFSWSRSFFGFSATETLGYALIIMALMMVSVMFEIKKLKKQSFTDQYQLQIAIMDSIMSTMIAADLAVPSSTKLQSFNPNSITADSLIGWGIPSKIVSNLTKYRQAGGTFRFKTDLRKIYGMNDSLWLVLKEYVMLPDRGPSKLPLKTNHKIRVKILKHPAPQLSPIDINVADTIQLMTIPGIGPVLSNRIVKYRNLLGGFFSKEQFREIYGLSPEVIEQLKLRVVIKLDYPYHKISLNTFDYQRIARHPYLSFAQAKAIVAYRDSHGPFKDLENLKAIHLINDSTYIKVYPYIDF